MWEPDVGRNFLPSPTFVRFVPLAGAVPDLFGPPLSHEGCQGCLALSELESDNECSDCCSLHNKFLPRTAAQPPGRTLATPCIGNQCGHLHHPDQTADGLQYPSREEAEYSAADRGFAVRRIQRLPPVQEFREDAMPRKASYLGLPLPGGAPRRVCVTDVFHPGEELPSDVLCIEHSHIDSRHQVAMSLLGGASLGLVPQVCPLLQVARAEAQTPGGM